LKLSERGHTEQAGVKGTRGKKKPPLRPVKERKRRKKKPNDSVVVKVG